MEWRKAFEPLRTRFQSDSSRWPHLRHYLLAARKQEIERLHERIIEPQRLMTAKAVGTTLRVPASHEQVFVYHVFGIDRSGPTKDDPAFAAFVDLATAAARLLEGMPPQVRALFSPPESPDRDAGVADNLWLASQFMKIPKEEGSLAGSHQEEHDQLRLWGCNGYNERYTYWCLAIHNLGWRARRAHLLHAKRSTWQGIENIGFASPGDLRQFAMLDQRDDDSPLLPLTRMRSDLPADLFLSSIWAIDILLAAAEETAQCSDTDHLPDERGYVVSPADPTAYLPLARILRQHVPLRWNLTTKQLRSVIDAPEIRKWHRTTNRLSVHLIDWLDYVAANPTGPKSAKDRGWCDDPKELEARKARVVPRSARKRAK